MSARLLSRTKMLEDKVEISEKVIITNSDRSHKS